MHKNDSMEVQWIDFYMNMQWNIYGEILVIEMVMFHI